MGRGAQPGEPPALHRRQPLADGVHLHDVRPGGQQLLRDVPQLLRRQQRPLKEGASAAGQQEQHRVLRRQALHRGDGGLRGPEGVLIRHRMARLIAHKAGNGALPVAVLGHHHAAAEGHTLRRRAGHLPRRLPHGHQHHFTGEFPALQRPAHCLVRQHRPNGPVRDPPGVPAQLVVHRHSSCHLFPNLTIPGGPPQALLDFFAAGPYTGPERGYTAPFLLI